MFSQPPPTFHSLTNRQKMNMVLEQVTKIYAMSFADLLWEYFRTPDSNGDTVERSSLHLASLERFLQGHESRTFSHILREVINDRLSQPRDPQARAEMFSATHSYLSIGPALPAITSFSMQLQQGHRQAYARPPPRMTSSQHPPVSSAHLVFQIAHLGVCIDYQV